jgi:hypothetical protein
MVVISVAITFIVRLSGDGALVKRPEQPQPVPAATAIAATTPAASATRDPIFLSPADWNRASSHEQEVRRILRTQQEIQAQVPESIKAAQRKLNEETAVLQRNYGLMLREFRERYKCAECQLDQYGRLIPPTQATAAK